MANRGPLLYRQERVGKGGTPLHDPEVPHHGPAAEGELVDEWTTEDDPRITRVRAACSARPTSTSCPQVVNILRGDLEHRGPPTRSSRTTSPSSTDKLPFYPLRHLVRPGLTGWAQVKYGYAGNETDALEKLQYEFWYLRHQSLRTDARIIGRTIRSVLGSEGAGR